MFCKLLPREIGNFPAITATARWFQDRMGRDFTGNLSDDAGRKFGYQLTLFPNRGHACCRHSAQPMGVRDLYFAHAAISDVHWPDVRLQGSDVAADVAWPNRPTKHLRSFA